MRTARLEAEWKKATGLVRQVMEDMETGVGWERNQPIDGAGRGHRVMETVGWIPS